MLLKKTFTGISYTNYRHQKKVINKAEKVLQGGIFHSDR